MKLELCIMCTTKTPRAVCFHMRTLRERVVSIKMRSKHWLKRFSKFWWPEGKHSDNLACAAVWAIVVASTICMAESSRLFRLLVESSKLYVGRITEKPIDCIPFGIWMALSCRISKPYQTSSWYSLSIQPNRQKKDSGGVIRAIYTCFRDRMGSVYHIRDRNRWHGEKSILLKSHLCERVRALTTNLYRSHIKTWKMAAKFVMAKKVNFPL